MYAHSFTHVFLNSWATSWEPIWLVLAYVGHFIMSVLAVRDRYSGWKLSMPVSFKKPYWIEMLWLKWNESDGYDFSIPLKFPHASLISLLKVLTMLFAFCCLHVGNILSSFSSTVDCPSCVHSASRHFCWWNKVSFINCSLWSLFQWCCVGY